MKIAGIIAEYNPIHEGHAYHIAETKKQLGADLVIVAMSGSYMQRGVPAFFDKFSRTREALNAGADLVVELPVTVSTGSAEYFATGAVKLLSRLGVNYISFGSECGDLDKLNALADLLLNESGDFKEELARELKNGASYPLAVKKAALSQAPDLAPLLDMPNNSLGLEYIKAIKRNNLNITPFTIRREGADYNDTEITEAEFPSSTALRNVYSQSEFPHLTNNDFSQMLTYALGVKGDRLTAYADVSTDLSNRISKAKDYANFDALTEFLKTRQVTQARVQRALWHIILDITKEDAEVIKAPDFPGYGRVLGFNKESVAPKLLKALEESSCETGFKLITRPAKDLNLLSESARKRFEKDLAAYRLYRLTMYQKYAGELSEEELKQITLDDYTSPLV